ncbi:hypothetical protein DFJ58DRAFT_842495 [Suillus subalutaceus]|uniref:uncharacterized protein n=1 Tax=Suillus subalutaceus TaxID=48586 RepID=UPI001B8733CF|nr:uncharacterized protein DFJ58DRAFT_842495 [Suillus subalutaceus]KAG1850222.1 hypothetical protein DFJ58DRAFT_842495 [Suillus subalutaceus]
MILSHSGIVGDEHASWEFIDASLTPTLVGEGQGNNYALQHLICQYNATTYQTPSVLHRACKAQIKLSVLVSSFYSVLSRKQWHLASSRNIRVPHTSIDGGDCKGKHKAKPLVGGCGSVYRCPTTTHHGTTDYEPGLLALLRACSRPPWYTGSRVQVSLLTCNPAPFRTYSETVQFPDLKENEKVPRFPQNSKFICLGNLASAVWLRAMMRILPK